jgi:hypothetical protein
MTRFGTDPCAASSNALRPIGGDQGAMTLVIKKQLQQLAYCPIVLDDRGGPAGQRAPLLLVLSVLRDVRDLGSPQRHLDGEGRARTHTRADIDVMAGPFAARAALAGERPASPVPRGNSTSPGRLAAICR